MINLNSMRGEFVGDGIPRTAGGRENVQSRPAETGLRLNRVETQRVKGKDT